MNRTLIYSGFCSGTPAESLRTACSCPLTCGVAIVARTYFYHLQYRGITSNHLQYLLALLDVLPPVNPCVRNPCLAGGTCVPLIETGVSYTYTCACPEGRSGALCEFEGEWNLPFFKYFPIFRASFPGCWSNPFPLFSFHVECSKRCLHTFLVTSLDPGGVSSSPI